MCPNTTCSSRVCAAAVGCMLAAWLAAVPARADQVLAGSDNYPRGRVSGFAGGVLRFLTPDGVTHRIPFAQVDQVVVDNFAWAKDFNAAETYLARQEPGSAAVRYERALRVAGDFWPNLIRLRLLQARDRAGHFNEAVVQFLHVAEAMPDAALGLVPTCIPDTAGDRTRRALERLDEVLRRQGGKPAEAPLQILHFAILEKVEPDKAAELAGAVVRLSAPESEFGGRSALRSVQLRALQLLQERGRNADVVAGVDRLLADAPEAVLPDCLLLKGRALYTSALESGSAEEFKQAGLAFMRVAIHYPSDARAGDALLWAARVHERIQRPAQAVQLLRECLARSDVSSSTRSDAQSLLRRLTG
ncbi:MAG: hypothetical protein JXB13_20375 [Phycisphaerae bacterium]|nr:hypothetical protein [Phycisphaerae bacterium]